MRRARPVMRNQLQTALAGILRRTGRSLSSDDVEVRPGRFFYVKESRERMEFGSNREGDLGADRPALLLKRWHTEFWFATPSSLCVPRPGQEKLSFRVDPVDWAFWSDSGAPRDEYLHYWYQRLITDFLYNHIGDLRNERLAELKSWLRDHHRGSASRRSDLEGDWEQLQ